MSRESNINTDPYKTGGRDHQRDEVIDEIHGHALTQMKSGIRLRGGIPFIGDSLRRSRHESRFERGRKAQSLRRTRKVRGLSARQLMERKMSLRATKRASSEMRKEE